MLQACIAEPTALPADAPTTVVDTASAGTNSSRTGGPCARRSTSARTTRWHRASASANHKQITSDWAAFRAFHRCLSAEGKLPKVVIVAVMRKVINMLNAMVRDKVVAAARSGERHTVPVAR